jgi:oligosaccharide repeat unit polymerase
VPKGADTYVIVPCLVIFYLLLFRSLAKPIQVGNIKSYIKIDVLFYLFSYILYYYPYQKYVLGLTDLTTQYSRLNQYIEYTNVSIILSTIAMLSFAIGYSRNKSQPKSVQIIMCQVKYKSINQLIVVVLLFAVILCIYFFKTNGIKALIYSYGSDDALIEFNTVPIYRELSFLIMLLSGLIVYYWKYYKQTNFIFILSIAMIMIWSLYILFSGDRNGFFLIAVILFAEYFTIIRSISRKYLFLSLFGALLLYNIVEIARASDNRNIDTYIESYKEMQQKDGNSFNITTLGYRSTFDLIPTQHDFFYGKFLFLSFTSIVPFLSAQFIEPNDTYKSSSSTLTYYLYGEFDLRGRGVGTNIISDLYMDFGVIGVIIMMIMMGLFSVFLQNKVQYNYNSIKWIVIYIITLSLFSEIARYSLVFAIRSISWTFLFFCFFQINRGKINDKHR